MKHQTHAVFSFAVFAASVLIPFFAVAEPLPEKLENLPAPALVECEDEATCDRNPEHLKAFVVGFYEWYVHNMRAAHLLVALRSRQEHENIFKTLHEKEDAFFSKSLTPAFRFHTGRVMYNDDSAEASVLCSDSIANPFLCTLYMPEEWLAKVSAHFDSISGDMCYLTVSLPKSRRSEIINPSYKILVRLSVYEGAWRIDRITDLLFPPRSDK